MISKHASVIAVGIGLIAVAAAAPRPPADTPECVKAAAWADENLSRLPTTYEAFSTFSGPYRRAIYARVPTDVRISLWHAHIQSSLRSLELDPQQVDFVQEIEGQLEEFFSNPQLDDMRLLFSEAQQRLGREAAVLTFTNLGGLGTSVVPGEACSCNKEQDDCPNGYACAVDGDSCDEIENECGFLGFFDCDGECLSP